MPDQNVAAAAAQLLADAEKTILADDIAALQRRLDAVRQVADTLGKLGFVCHCLALHGGEEYDVASRAYARAVAMIAKALEDDELATEVS